MEESEKLSSKERKLFLHKIVSACRALGEKYVKDWKPVNPDWAIVEGCAYIRLSDESQVLVEKGSLEQQINLAVNEALTRSNSDRVNYKIAHFYVEPGISGKHDRRPELNKMTKGIRKGHYGFMIMKEISRVFRESRLWKEFFLNCIASECEIFIRGFPFNPNDPTQVLQLDILAAFAEYESRVNSKRLKESIFSAMVTSGKFNSTHEVLGLDQLVLDGRPQVGFYMANENELKTVTWIMQTFIKYASYQKTLEECKKRGIRNKNDQPFHKNSLKRLLTDTRYIGKWELNKLNKDRNQDKLMPYERHQIVELPHGEILDKNLWNQVQVTAKRISGASHKNTGTRYVYTLSGLLRHRDGSSFHGRSAKGSSSRYYFNSQHNFSLVAEAVEHHAHEMVREIIKKSPALEQAIIKKGKHTKAASELLDTEIEKLKLEIEGLEGEKLKINRRIDFLVDGEESDGIAELKMEAVRESLEIRERIKELKNNIVAIERKQRDLQQEELNWDEIGGNTGRILPNQRFKILKTLRIQPGPEFARIKPFT